METEIIAGLVAALIGMGVYFKQQLGLKSKFIKELEEKLEKEQKLLKEREETISEKDKLISHKDSTLAERERALFQARVQHLNYELSPHALKNTLSLILDQSAKTHRALEKTGDLLNYMLYDTSLNYVRLKDELKFLKNYLDLNKVMVPHWVSKMVTLEVPNLSDDFQQNYAIAPLIMIYFAENAFKHADLEKPGSYARFRITQSGPGEITYSVENLVRIVNEKKKHSGIGGKNLLERLDMLYPNRYRLSGEEKDGEFTAILTLKLAKYED